jgi:hypothetical protein
MRTSNHGGGEERVERLRWFLIAAVSGASVAVAACRVESNGDEYADGAGRGGSGGTAAGKGAQGGSATGGRNAGGKAGCGPGPDEAGGTCASIDGGAGQGGADTGGADQGGAGQGGAGQGGGEIGNRACTPVASASGDYGTTAVLCEGEFVHRPSPGRCELPPRETAEGGAGGDTGAGGHGGASGGAGGSECQDEFDCSEYECGYDYECTERPHGYCMHYIPPGGGTRCEYGCETDADCESDELCSCSPGLGGRCVVAGCKADADCGEGFLCVSPTNVSDCGEPPNDFHCQAPEDECSGHAECEQGEECAPYAGRFECQGREVCGRPFLIDGRARSASLVFGTRWANPTASSSAPEALSQAAERRIAEHWLENALMEHASIAAFARFALELLALGAPAELVEAATSAMADETRHTKLCFELAARYGAADLAPGPLAMGGAIASFELINVVDRAILEGCFGETGAALEAGWAAEGATDPVVRSALETIAADEARHAALAFRFVAWAAERDARVLPLLERRLREELARPSRPTSARAAAELDTLARHGVLDRATREAARRQALSEIVAPAVRALAERRAPGTLQSQEFVEC